jgi:hypothetical protein
MTFRARGRMMSLMKRPRSSWPALAVAALCLPLLSAEARERDKPGDKKGAPPPCEEAPDVLRPANAFLNSLNLSTQKTPIDATADNSNTSALYNPTLDNAVVWSDGPISLQGGSTRNGLVLQGLTGAQQKAVRDLVDAALSPEGRRLFEEKRGPGQGQGQPAQAPNDEHIRFVGLIGTPSENQPWTLQLTGHHLALNLTYNAPYLSSTPLFASSKPLPKPKEGVTSFSQPGKPTPPPSPREIAAKLRPTLPRSAELPDVYTDLYFPPNGDDVPLGTTRHDSIQPKAFPEDADPRGARYTRLHPGLGPHPAGAYRPRAPGHLPEPAGPGGNLCGLQRG